MASKKNTFQTEFFCTRCGHKHSIHRKDNKRKKSGHLKKLYCIRCKEEVNAVEFGAYSSYTPQDFVKEYLFNNFSEEGDRIDAVGDIRKDWEDMLEQIDWFTEEKEGV